MCPASACVRAPSLAQARAAQVPPAFEGRRVLHLWHIDPAWAAWRKHLFFGSTVRHGTVRRLGDGSVGLRVVSMVILTL